MIRIFNVERFATHDGPGIRTVIFMQGCPLHCPWCSNPESQSLKSQLMYNVNSCALCRSCENSCGTGAISFSNGTFHYNAATCTYCRSCEDICPSMAIEFAGEERTTEEIIAEVLRDQAYYANSGGGVTLSGGEPFVQFESFMELLHKLKACKINIAVETTGQYPLDQLKEALPLIDTFLFDIKHLDKDLLKSTLGGNLEQIMTNFQYIAQTAPAKLIVRVPVIPDFNDQEATLESIIRLSRTHGIKEVNLLPYHTLGKIKYAKMSKPYPMGPQPMLSKTTLEKYQNIGKINGVKVIIGG